MTSTIKPIYKIFISNRGEIAERISRCCDRLGIQSVSAHILGEEQRPYVRRSVHSVLVQPGDFLSPEAMVNAARLSGCDAVHPGYGFLSESATFAEAVQQAGLTWIGPSPAAIRAMGDKSRAKTLIASTPEALHHIPLIPGFSGADQSLATFLAEARRVGYPVLLKAAAGGGGKGMRVVREEGEMEAAMQLARSEALRSFGDATLLLERFFEQVRHVEVQVLGDLHGNAMHLYERECSVQRRHQKLVEESPSPLMTPSLRQRMTTAALTLAHLIGYAGAGTVEFIVEPDGQRFYFLEVNTRLQVEHPVTEQVLGLDLVALQIHVAAGHDLPSLFPNQPYDPVARTVTPPPLQGHAIECRLCAEDPARGFFPCTGRVLLWRPAQEVEGVRYDSDVQAGGEVSIHFDPLLCKLIATGASREEALRRAGLALRRTVLLGVTTNKDFLAQILAHPVFQAGQLTTGFIDQHLAAAAAGLAFSSTTLADRTVLAVAAFVQQWRAQEQHRTLLRHLPSGWRNSPYQLQTRRFTWAAEDEPHTTEVRYRYASRRNAQVWPVRFAPVHVEHWGSGSRAGEPLAASAHEVTVFESASPTELSFAVDQQRYTVAACTDPAEQRIYLHCAALEQLCTTTLAPLSLLTSHAGDSESAENTYVSPMPSRILQVHVDDGQAVDLGEAVLTIESMKMEVRIVAKTAGIVKLYVTPGQLIDAGFEMFEIRPSSS